MGGADTTAMSTPLPGLRRTVLACAEPMAFADSMHNADPMAGTHLRTVAFKTPAPLADADNAPTASRSHPRRRGECASP